MRIVVLIVVSALVLAAASAFGLSRLIERDDLRTRLIHEAEALTGRELAVEGAVELDILPRPTLTMAGASFATPPGASDGVQLSVDRVDFRVRPLSLLGGDLEVDEVRLVGPVLRVRDAGLAGLTPERLLAGGPLLPIALRRAGRFRVVDGLAVLENAREQGDHVLEEIDLEVDAQDARGPFRIDGRFAVAGQAFSLSGRLGRLSDDPSTTLRLEVRAEEPRAGAVRVGFRGLVAGAVMTRLDGRLTIAGDDVTAGVAALAAALGRPPPSLPPWLTRAYEVSGTLSSSDHRLEVTDLVVALPGAEAEGRLGVVLADPPDVDLALDVGRLDLPDPLPVAGDHFDALGALAASVRGRLDLTVGLLGYRGETARRLRLTLAPTGDGDVRVTRARAILPGNADVSFTGAISTTGGTPRIEGDLVAVTDRLRTLLAWLGAAPGRVPGDRLRSLSLSSEVALTPASLRLFEVEATLDGATLGGSLAVELGARRQFAAALSLDRLDLDAYWPDTGPEQVMADLRRLLDVADAALQANVDRLTWRGLRWRDVVLDGRGIEGKVTLEELSARAVADASLALSGTIDLGAERFALDGRLEAPRPALLARRLGVTPPLALARLDRLHLDGKAHGWIRQTHVDLKVLLDRLEVGLDGRITWSEDGRTGYLLEVEASHPDYAGLLGSLGVAAPPDDADHARAPFGLTGRLRREAGVAFAIVGSTDLGPTRVTGDAVVKRNGPRPEVNARLSVGDARFATLLPLLALAGVPIDASYWAQPVGGRWVRQPLRLGWLEEIDGALDVTGKGGFAGDGLELKARLDDRHLVIERFATNALDGAMSIEAALDLGDRSPFLAVAVTLSAIDPARLLSWLGLDPVLEGRAGLYAEATAVGWSPHAMMRSLAADLRVELEGATLRPGEALPEALRAGLEVTGWQTELVAKRGIITVDPVELDLGRARARISGTIDAFLWLADLTLAVVPDETLEAEPVTLRIVGPLDDPQVVERTVPAADPPGQVSPP